MAVPAPAIPAGNAYTVNVARPSGDASPLSPFAFAAARLLRRWKIPVRMHLAGDSASTNALRSRLNEAGARPSAFSPAPSPEVPGEGFWKTTMIVVENPGTEEPDTRFWAEDRADKKVDWDPLMIALTEDTAFARLAPPHIAKPDLWVVSAMEPVTGQAGQGADSGGSRDVVRRWVDAGARAVCVVDRDEVSWHTGSAAFGRSAGARARLSPPSPSSAEIQREYSEGTLAPTALGVFAAGVVTGLMRDLLAENLFDKTLLRADRECLGMRPLRLGRAVIEGLAALEALAARDVSDTTGNSFASPGDALKGLAERAEARRVALLGPPSRSWAHKGR